MLSQVISKRVLRGSPSILFKPVFFTQPLRFFAAAAP